MPLAARRSTTSTTSRLQPRLDRAIETVLVAMNRQVGEAERGQHLTHLDSLLAADLQQHRAAGVEAARRRLGGAWQNGGPAGTAVDRPARPVPPGVARAGGGAPRR